MNIRCCLEYKSEHVLCIYQTQTTRQTHLHVSDILTSTWKKESWRGLFAGNGANCVRVLPFSALVCLAYYNMAKVSNIMAKVSDR